MCGRFVVSYTYDELIKLLDNDFEDIDQKQVVSLPRYNIVPTEKVYSLINDGKCYRLVTLKWGFNSSFNNAPLINARSETIDSKQTFKDSFFNKRSILPVSGFYEWDRKKGKVPYYFKNEDDKPLYFASIWGSYKENDETIYTTSILTREATKEMIEIHDRIPVILSSEQAKSWMNPDMNDLNTLKDIINNGNQIELMKYQVSNKVNKVGFDNIDCLKPYTDNVLF